MGEIESEIAILQKEHANESKGTWAEVFDKTNRVNIDMTIVSPSQMLILSSAPNGSRSPCYVWTANHWPSLRFAIFRHLLPATGLYKRGVPIHGAQQCSLFCVPYRHLVYCGRRWSQARTPSRRSRLALC